MENWSENITQNLKRLKKAKGLSQESLAEAVGCSKSVIRDLESGRNAVSLDMLGRIAHALNVSISEMLIAQDNSNPKHDTKVMDKIEAVGHQLDSIKKAIQSRDEANPQTRSKVPHDILTALENADEYDLRSIRNILDLPIPETKKKAN